MTSLSSSEARQNFPELVNKAAFAKHRIVITRRGKNIAAIIPMEDLETLQALEDKIDLEDAKKALKEIKKKGGIAWDKLKSELGL